jgi:general secretion pathway protein G
MMGSTKGRLPSDAGLTILELMVVLVILSIIGVVVSFQVVGQMDRAKVDIARLQLRQLQNALTLFDLDTHRYPSALEGLGALLSPPDETTNWRGPYVKNKELFADPWGRAISYVMDEAGHYSLVSLGADGKGAGQGSAADIVLGEAQ